MKNLTWVRSLMFVIFHIAIYFFQEYSAVYFNFSAHHNSVICFYELFLFDCFNTVWNGSFKSCSCWIRYTCVWFICVFNSTGCIIGWCILFLEMGSLKKICFKKCIYLFNFRQHLDAPLVFNLVLHGFVLLQDEKDIFWHQCHISIMIALHLDPQLHYR